MARIRTKKKNEPILKHGDTFHVYIASDTPQYICDFLTNLKRSGDFSQEILSIIDTHIHSMGVGIDEEQAQNNNQAIAINPIADDQLANGQHVIEQYANEPLVDGQISNETIETRQDSTASQGVKEYSSKTDPNPAVQPETNVEPESVVQPEPPVQAEPSIQNVLTDPIEALRKQRRAWISKVPMN